MQRLFNDGQMEGGCESPPFEASVFGTDEPNTIHVRKIEQFTLK